MFGAQFTLIAIWNCFGFSRFSITENGATQIQAMSLISHGNFDPTVTTFGLRFFNDHFALIDWPHSIVSYIPLSGFGLFLLQDAAVVGTVVVAFTWIRWVVDRVGLANQAEAATVLTGLGLLVLVANPWVYTAGGKPKTISIPFSVNSLAPSPTSFPGIGPFRIDPIPSHLQGNDIEIRVWTPAGGSLSVRSRQVTK